jgi:hypothetical protein
MEKLIIHYKRLNFVQHEKTSQNVYHEHFSRGVYENLNEKKKFFMPIGSFPNPELFFRRKCGKSFL